MSESIPQIRGHSHSQLPWQYHGGDEGSSASDRIEIFRLWLMDQLVAKSWLSIYGISLRPLVLVAHVVMLSV
jgi:hypothetical protein